MNLAPKRGPSVGHFVTIVGRGRKILYVDPYGFPPTDRRLDAFFQDCLRPVTYSSTQAQALESTFCGVYAMLFTLYFDNLKWGDKASVFSLKFSSSDFALNDRLAVKYLKRMVNIYVSRK